MYNPVDFDAGRSWSEWKTRIFNIFFSGLRVSFDWHEKDLGFLTDVKSLQRLTVETTRVLDITSLESCHLLRSLVLQCKIPKKMHSVNISHLNQLVFYLGPDIGQMQSLYRNRTLKRIHIYKYASSDLSAWSTASLEHLTIDDSPNLKSLNGIQDMHNLKLVELNNCMNIERVSFYKNQYPYLKIYVNGDLRT